MTNPSSPILDGIRVVEVSTYVFGPACATILSDFGAEIIKVEPPGMGDPYRHLHLIRPNPVSDIPYMFLLDGRNKKSIVVDLKRDEGQKIVHELVDSADIFVTNYHQSVLADLNLQYEDLQARNDRLIYAHATGYGQEGPDVEQPGYDMTAYWARSGLMDLIRSADNDPALSVAGLGDHPSSVSLFSAVMLGLYQRERTGTGSKVSTSLIANGAWANGCFIQGALAGAGPYTYPSRKTTPNPLVNHYTTRDEKRFILCGVRGEKDWQACCRSIDRPELAEDPRYNSPEGRVKHSAEIIALLDTAFAKKDLAEWRDIFKSEELTHSPVWNFQDMADDPAMTANDVIVPMDHPEYGPMRTVDSPMKVHGSQKVSPKAAPGLGQHTEETLTNLGYSASEIEQLKSTGIVETSTS